MVKLSVNINKIATLRNARGENNPNVLKAALDIESYGANGITVHPRPDQRHIKYDDVYAIKEKIKVELNVEGYPGKEYMDLVKKVRPAQATLVPDGPGVLTSDAGWEVAKNKYLLAEVIKELKAAGARVSLFVDPKTTSREDLILSRELGADRIELYTKKYADEFTKGNGESAIGAYRNIAQMAVSAGLEINAGHDLNLDNLNFFAKNIPKLKEVSIGHALICDALYFGLKQTVERYLEQAKI